MRRCPPSHRDASRQADRELVRVLRHRRRARARREGPPERGCRAQVCRREGLPSGLGREPLRAPGSRPGSDGGPAPERTERLRAARLGRRPSAGAHRTTPRGRINRGSRRQGAGRAAGTRTARRDSASFPRPPRPSHGRRVLLQLPSPRTVTPNSGLSWRCPSLALPVVAARRRVERASFVLPLEESWVSTSRMTKPVCSLATWRV